MKRDDIVNIIGNLMKEPKLSSIKIRLTNNESLVIYSKGSDRSKAIDQTYFLKVVTKQGNYTSHEFIPYNNIFYVTGNINQ